MKDTHAAQHRQSFFPGQIASFQIVDKHEVRFQFAPEHNDAQFADAETKALLCGGQIGRFLHRRDMYPLGPGDLRSGQACAADNNLIVYLRGDRDPFIKWGVPAGALAGGVGAAGKLAGGAHPGAG